MNFHRPPNSLWIHEIISDVRALSIALISAIVAGYLLNSFRENPIGFGYQTPEERLKIAAAMLAGNHVHQANPIQIKSMTAAEVKSELSNATTLIIDARSEAFFRYSHIPGAVSLPRKSFKETYPLVENRLKEAKLVVVYCSDQDCDDSIMVANALKTLGMKHLYQFSGGMAEWEDADFPTESDL